MYKHLYELKKVCPGIVHDIEFTDEIKEKIMDNRIYHPPKEKKPTLVQNIQNNIQNNNIVNNFINNMDSTNKIDKYLEYNDQELLCLEEDIESKFGARVNRLENNLFKYGYDIDQNRLFDIIDEISKIKKGEFKQLNIVYDEKMKELNLYKSGSWEVYLVDIGIKEVMSILKDQFLDYYEKYIVKNIYVFETSEIKKGKLKNDLIEHYKVLACFDLLPYIKDKNNEELVGKEYHNTNEYSIEEKWLNEYNNIVNTIKQVEINKMKKNIENILKNNSKRSVKDLNKQIINLLNIDEDFKKELEL